MWDVVLGQGTWLVELAVTPTSSQHSQGVFLALELVLKGSENCNTLPYLEQVSNVFTEEVTTVVSILCGEENVGQHSHFSHFPLTERWLDLNRTWLFPVVELGHQARLACR